MALNTYRLPACLFVHRATPRTIRPLANSDPGWPMLLCRYRARLPEEISSLLLRHAFLVRRRVESEPALFFLVQGCKFLHGHYFAFRRVEQRAEKAFYPRCRAIWQMGCHLQRLYPDQDRAGSGVAAICFPSFCEGRILTTCPEARLSDGLMMTWSSGDKP